MGEEGHARDRVPKRQESLHRLQGEPDAEEDPCRHLEHGEEEAQGHDADHARSREQHDVGAEHAGDRPAGADQRHLAERSDQHLGGGRHHPADEIEGDEPRPRHGIFHVVAEDPQVQHVEDQMEPAAVHEERREQGRPPRDEAERRQVHLVCELVGPRPGEVVPAVEREPPARQRQLEREHGDVDQDDGQGHHGKTTRGDVVVERYHETPLRQVTLRRSRDRRTP